MKCEQNYLGIPSDDHDDDNDADYYYNDDDDDNVYESIGAACRQER